MESENVVRGRDSSRGSRWMIVGSFACALLSLPISALLFPYPAPRWQGDLVWFVISGGGLVLGAAALRRTGSRSGRWLSIAALSIGAVVVAFEVYGVILQATGALDIAPPD